MNRKIGPIVLLLLLTSVFSYAKANAGFLCAEDGSSRWVLRVVPAYNMTLSRYNGYEKTYYDVEFGIAAEEQAEGVISFVSNVQEPDGDKVEVALSVDTNKAGLSKSARWLAIEFFPKDSNENFLGTITVNEKEYKATCIELK